MRESIKNYLNERCLEKQEPLQKKLQKLAAGNDDEAQQLRDQLDKISNQFELATWLQDAAKRATQIKLVTHVLKMTHPEAKGSSVHATHDCEEAHGFLATSSLGEQRKVDVVGNAGALDIYKFLSLEVEGDMLLNYALRRDTEFLSALSDNPQQAIVWCEAFASLTQLEGAPSSHPLAKQIYWPLENGEYRLLAPLASSSLAQAVFEHINDERFSQEAKQARKARKDASWSERPVRYFPSLVAQKMGGSKPQNISILCSQRGGANYLLASLPPLWRTPEVRLPLRRKSVFDRSLSLDKSVRPLLLGLAKFLSRVPKDITNIRVRNKRAEYIKAIIDQVLEYSFQLQAEAPGWSAKSRLSVEECRWLDPGRCEYDESFNLSCQGVDWRDRVSQAFGRWLNAELVRAGLSVGHTEFTEWRDEFDADLAQEQQWFSEVLV